MQTYGGLLRLFSKKDKNNMDPSLTVTGVQAICEISWGRQN